MEVENKWGLRGPGSNSDQGGWQAVVGSCRPWALGGAECREIPQILPQLTTYHPKVIKGYPRPIYTSATLHGSQPWPLDTSGREQSGQVS